MIKNRRKKHKLTKVCLYYSNVADFTRWSGPATPFNEYKMNVVKNIQVLGVKEIRYCPSFLTRTSTWNSSPKSASTAKPK